MAQKKKRNYRNKQSHNNGNRDQGTSGPTPDISNAKPLDNGQEMHLTELKQKQIAELIELANQMGIEGVARSRKQDVIFAILKAHAKGGEDIYGDGVLEILQDGFGFLRSATSVASSAGCCRITSDLSGGTSVRSSVFPQMCRPPPR